MSRISVVILNYNGEKLLMQFLPSVVRYSNGAEIVVADNGSTDRSLAVLRLHFPEVRIVELGENYGFCGGYNRALQQINSTYYVLLNSDVEVTEDWLTKPLDILEIRSEVAAIQPKILSYHQRDLFEYAGAAGGLIDTLGYPFCRGRILRTIESDKNQYPSGQIFWGSGACLFIRSSVYHTLGGLDEDFFAHMEEIDLCWKINRTNQIVYYCAESSVYHLGAGTLSYESPRKIYLNFRNGLQLITKHWSPGELVFKLPLRILLDWTAALVFVSSGALHNAWSVVRAHWAYALTIARTWEKRSQIMEKHPHYSRKSVFGGSILVEFYLKGRKTVQSFISNPK